jgi:hypothetical protein
MSGESNGFASVFVYYCTSQTTHVFYYYFVRRFEPLDHDATERLSIELCGVCCSACYPSEDDDEIHHHYHARNTYQSPTPPSTMAVSARWGGGETIV